MDASGGTTPIAPAGHPKTAQSMEGSSTAGTTPISGDVGEMEMAMHPTTTTTEETPAAVVKESITVSEPQNQQVGEGRSTNGSGSILHEGEDEELGARRSSRKRSSRKKHKKHRRHSRGRSSSDLAGSGGAASELVRAVDGEREVAEHAASAPQHPSEARKEKKHRKHHSGSNRPRSANDGSTARWCEEEEGQPEGKKEEEQQQQQQQHNSSVGMPPLPVVLPLHLQTVGQAEYATEAGSPLQSVRKATGTTPRSSSHASAVAATTPDQPASSAPATTAPVAGVCGEQEEADAAAPSPPPPIGPSTEAAEGPIFCDGSEEDEDAFRPVARPLSEPSAVAVEVLPPPSTTTSLILAPLPPLEEVCQARRSASAVVEVQEDLDGAAPAAAAAAAAENHLNFSDEDDEMSEGLRRLQQYPFLSTTDEEMIDVDASSQSHPLGSANPRSHPQDSRPPHQHREYSHADQNDLRHRGTEEQDNDFSPATGDTATEVDESLYKQPLFSCLQDRSVVNGWQLHHPRRHAFELPLHHYQVIALVVKVVGAILYFSSVLPAYIQLYVGNYGTSSLIECIIFTLLVVVLMGILFASYFILSFRNVTDESNTGDVCVYCSRRTPDTAYHCRACNRCVDGFDHHCKWLNTCIGKNNYRLFITYLASASSGMFVTFVASLVLLAQWWHQLSHFSLFFRIAPLILCVLMALGLGPILHLFLFHLILIRLDTSTIHYMQEKRRRVARGEPPGGVLCY